MTQKWAVCTKRAGEAPVVKSRHDSPEEAVEHVMGSKNKRGAYSLLLPLDKDGQPIVHKHIQ